jgi:hypothetical protein
MGNDEDQDTTERRHARMVRADEIRWDPEPEPYRDVVLLAQIMDRLRPLTEQEKAEWILSELHDKAVLRLTLQACMDALHQAQRAGARQ